MTHYIHLVSGPGAGKSTIGSLLYGQMKIQGWNVEFVQEFAKTLVWREEWDKLNDQRYVSERQFRLLHSLKGKVDWVVTDGGLIPGLYYNRVNPNNISNVEKTESAILQWQAELPGTVIFLKRDDFPFEEAGRIQTYSESLEADQGIRELLERHSLPYTIFRSRTESIPGMIDFIIENRR